MSKTSSSASTYFGDGAASRAARAASAKSRASRTRSGVAALGT